MTLMNMYPQYIILQDAATPWTIKKQKTLPVSLYYKLHN